MKQVIVELIKVTRLELKEVIVSLFFLGKPLCYREKMGYKCQGRVCKGNEPH